MDIINNFNKLFNKKTVEDENIQPENYVGYLDNASVMMVIPKLKSVEEALREKFDIKPQKVLELNYNHYYAKSREVIEVHERIKGGIVESGENRVKISKDYLKVVLKCCMHSVSEAIIIKQKKDYPLWVECDELICIIAPRVGNGN